MFGIKTVHHVSLPVTDLERARRFYTKIVGLVEIARPNFDFPGTWYQVGDRTLHLIVHDRSTFRTGKGVDSRDIHFAIRVDSYRETRDFLRSKGYHPDAADEFMKMRESPKATAGFPQLYIMDPDRNVIELNADRLDLDEAELKALGLT
jgi:catechol 2,3-dioxygenase-like lactoylglutathione lyase family enzyme